MADKEISKQLNESYQNTFNADGLRFLPGRIHH